MHKLMLPVVIWSSRNDINSCRVIQKAKNGPGHQRFFSVGFFFFPPYNLCSTDAYGTESGRYNLSHYPLTCGIKLHNSESYKAGLFIAAPGARGIAPPNLHTESRSMHLFITKLI